MCIYLPYLIYAQLSASYGGLKTMSVGSAPSNGVCEAESRLTFRGKSFGSYQRHFSYPITVRENWQIWLCRSLRGSFCTRKLWKVVHNTVECVIIGHWLIRLRDLQSFITVTWLNPPTFHEPETWVDYDIFYCERDCWKWINFPLKAVCLSCTIIAID